MNTIFRLSALLFLCACSGNSDKANEAEVTVTEESQEAVLEEVWRSEAVLKQPQDLIYDKERDQYFISNQNGGEAEANGMGFITRMFADGKVDELDWVGGLDAPKGIDIYGDQLWVADIDKVFQLDILTAEPVNTFRSDSAKMLDGLLINKEGTVYVTGSEFRIFKVVEGLLSEVTDMDEIKFAEDRMYIPNEVIDQLDPELDITDIEYIESKSLYLVVSRSSNQIIAYKLNK